MVGLRGGNQFFGFLRRGGNLFSRSHHVFFPPTVQPKGKQEESTCVPPNLEKDHPSFNRKNWKTLPLDIQIHPEKVF